MITDTKNLTKFEKYMYFMNKRGMHICDKLVRDFLHTMGFIQRWRSTFYHLPGNRLCVKVYNYGISLHDGNDSMADNFTIWFYNEYEIKAFFQAVFDDIVDYRKILMRIKSSKIEKELEVLE